MDTAIHWYMILSLIITSDDGTKLLLPLSRNFHLRLENLWLGIWLLQRIEKCLNRTWTLHHLSYWGQTFLVSCFGTQDLTLYIFSFVKLRFWHVIVHRNGCSWESVEENTLIQVDLNSNLPINADCSTIWATLTRYFWNTGFGDNSNVTMYASYVITKCLASFKLRYGLFVYK